MTSVDLGILSAMSYSWNKHDDGFIVIRTARAIAAGIRAVFTKYTVSLTDAQIEVGKHPNAWFAASIQRALGERRVSQVKAADQDPTLSVHSPYGFNLGESATNRVKFIGTQPAPADVLTAYREMRAAAGELWVKTAGLRCLKADVDDADHIVFSNKGHDVQSKYLVQIIHPLQRSASFEEVLQVKDNRSGQLKLVRIGSFSEAANGSTIGGGGFPGYSGISATKAGVYLKNLVVKDNNGNDYRPYQRTTFGLGSHDRNNVGSAWSCGFDALRMGIFQATGYKFSFQVLVAFLEEIISAREDADDLRRCMSDQHYPMSRDVMKLILSDIVASPAYPDLLVEEGARDARSVLPEERKGGCRVRICKRQEILDTTNWDYSSTAMLCQPAHAFGLYRNKTSDGNFEYMVYDPHNFGGKVDFYTSANGEGRKVFQSARQAIDYVTTRKGGCNGNLDGFYRVPDTGLCYLREKMMKTKDRLEVEGIGF